MTGTIQLQHKELLKKIPYEPILMPRNIPVHPTVFDSDFAYSPDFVRVVQEAVPEYAKLDASLIESVLGISGIIVTDDAITFRGQSIEFNDPLISYVSSPEKRTVDVGGGDTNIALDAMRSGEFNYHNALYISHPMPTEKLQEYMIHKDGEPFLLMWYEHNSLIAGLPMGLLFRNFAIAFNNLGLEKLASE